MFNYEASSNFLKEFNVSSKVKTMEEKGVRVRALARNILGVRRVC
jgi:hypothetical protein